MAHTVQVQTTAARELAALPSSAKARVRAKIDALSGDPRPFGCIKMAGEDGLYRIRVGDYRVIYAVRDNVLLVLVVCIGHRREVYRRR